MAIKTNFCLVFISYLLINSLSLQAQTARILVSSKEIQGSPATTNIKKITRKLAGPFITVHYLNGSKQKVLSRDVWGYIDQYGQLYRQYKNDFFQVSNQTDLIEYKEFYVVSGRHVPMARTSYYYSRDLDSPIYKSRNDALSSLQK